MPRKGPSGWYSNAWMSRADQSFNSDDSENVIRRLVDRTGCPCCSPCRPRSRARPRGRGAELGRYRGPSGRCDHARTAAEPACRSRRPCRLGRDIREARAATPPEAGRSPDAGSVPCSPRGIRKHRSHRSRRPRRPVERCGAELGSSASPEAPCHEISVRRSSTVSPDAGPSDMKRLSVVSRKSVIRNCNDAESPGRLQADRGRCTCLRASPTTAGPTSPTNSDPYASTRQRSTGRRRPAESTSLTSIGCRVSVTGCRVAPARARSPRREP